MINVIITGIGGGGIGEQILKALKISSLDLKLFGTDTTNLSKNIFEVKKMFIIRPAYSNGYCMELLNICLKNNINVIFPGSEPELKVISNNREFLGWTPPRTEPSQKLGPGGGSSSTDSTSSKYQVS